jgi:protoporphyrin/coproporphyrin ferrochelatase
MKEAVLLINLGTPDHPDPVNVGTYLTQFLNDKRVIDIHPVSRFFLVNFIIVPLRSFKSSRLYKHIWRKEGSPLLTNSTKLKEALQTSLGERYIVELAMRYRKPSIKEALQKIMKQIPAKIHVLPLYPQYSGSSTGSSIELLMQELGKFEVIPTLNIVSKFYDHPAFYDAMLDQAGKYKIEAYDHVLFSYHGLPERQILKASSECGRVCNLGACCDSIAYGNEYCYRAACFETTRRMVEALGIPSGKYSSAFQSRLNDKWLKPFSDKVVEELAKSGTKRLLVFSPAFVADCLETIFEIGEEYDEIFQKHGGEKLTLVESLNYNQAWIKAIREILNVG